jgi:hypothetical protein
MASCGIVCFLALPVMALAQKPLASLSQASDSMAGGSSQWESAVVENTLVFYVWSDNGSSSEGQRGSISELLAHNGIATSSLAGRQSEWTV